MSPALILAVVIALCVVVVSRSHQTCERCDANNTAAQANIQTALNGAETYYAANDHSFVGIDGGPQLPAGVSSISEIDIGLTFIAGDQSSPAPNVVSIYAASPSVVVVTAYLKAIQTCWGILSVARRRAAAYFPAYPDTVPLARTTSMEARRHRRAAGCKRGPDGVEHDRVPSGLIYATPLTWQVTPIHPVVCPAVARGHSYRRPNKSGDSFFGAFSAGAPIRSQTFSTSDACSVRKTSLLSDGPRSIRTPTRHLLLAQKTTVSSGPNQIASALLISV